MKIDTVCPSCCESDTCVYDCTYGDDFPDDAARLAQRRLEAADVLLIRRRLANAWTEGYRAGTLDPPNFMSSNPFSGEEK